MMIFVSPDPAAGAAHHGRLAFAGREYPCALGQAGVTRTKREGDHATPAGQFALREVLYRADRIDLPRLHLPARAIAPDDGWCDDDTRPEYNQPVRLPFAGSYENLWRDDGIYDLIVVIGYNDDPPVPGAGSAIFLHLARPMLEPTEGCVALARADLIGMVGRFSPGDDIVIAGPDGAPA
jgi:L,D-peptidoglycan transpeptidase YkuD (ErfK/YbiS/YcfS/YnhG family)